MPNTLPSSEKFEIAAQKLGINKNSLIVVYDMYGIYSAPRAWWLFKTFGHKNVGVLDGGLPEWNKNNLPVEPPNDNIYKQGDFKANFKENLINDYNDVLLAINLENKLILDARSANRFEGKVKEPREGLRSGHIPNSKNLPYSELLKDNKLLDKEAIKSASLKNYLIKMTKSFFHVVLVLPLVF